jgi:hypothetical protein
VDDALGRDPGFGNIFHDLIENGVEIQSAPEDEAGGGGMAVNGTVVGNLILLGHAPDIAPVEVILFDVVAEWVMADGAFALMAREKFVFFGAA